MYLIFLHTFVFLSLYAFVTCSCSYCSQYYIVRLFHEIRKRKWHRVNRRVHCVCVFFSSSTQIKNKEQTAETNTPTVTNSKLSQNASHNNINSVKAGRWAVSN